MSQQLQLALFIKLYRLVDSWYYTNSRESAYIPIEVAIIGIMSGLMGLHNIFFTSSLTKLNIELSMSYGNCKREKSQISLVLALITVCP